MINFDDVLSFSDGTTTFFGFWDGEHPVYRTQKCLNKDRIYSDDFEDMPLAEFILELQEYLQANILDVKLDIVFKQEGVIKCFSRKKDEQPSPLIRFRPL